MAATPPHSPKRLKMSSSDDSNAAGAGAAPKPRYKRRKIAIFLAYNGHGYQGMQKNPGARTIEGDLEQALFHAGAVPESERACPNRYDWARSARTDKGVSACGQVISGRFYVDPPGFVDRLNAALSPQIRVFGFKRATPGFSAKKFCDRRRYVYLLPMFALDPAIHRDRESVAASQGMGSELEKCVECSERGRKVPGLFGPSWQREVRRTGVKNENLDAETTIKADNSGEESRGLEEKVEAVVANVVEDEGFSESVREDVSTDVDMGVNGEQKIGEFRYGDEEKERFNGILKRYEGTHNFHNLTTRTKAVDPAAQRFIISFNANSVIRIDGIDFIKCEVVGQSFMLHQIRKMIGLAVAVMRNCAPESLMDIALRKDINITVPTAPEVGLFLDECFFTSYNQKWEDTHEELSMKGYEEQAEEFKIKNIYTHIASMEHKEGAVALWLHSLNPRNYPDFNYHETHGISATAENDGGEKPSVQLF